MILYLKVRVKPSTLDFFTKLFTIAFGEDNEAERAKWQLAKKIVSGLNSGLIMKFGCSSDLPAHHKS